VSALDICSAASRKASRSVEKEVDRLVWRRQANHPQMASESSMLIELLTGTPNRLRVSCRWIMAITRDFRFS